MAEHIQVPVDTKQVKNANETWHKFAHGSKYAIVGIIAVLIFLAVVFIGFPMMLR